MLLTAEHSSLSLYSWRSGFLLRSKSTYLSDVPEGSIKLKSGTLQAIKEKKILKGDVFPAARLAAINAVKKASELILLAHPIAITNVEVNLEIDEDQSAVKLTTKVKSTGKTGVEIEALMGVSVGLLTIFDMCKYLEKNEVGQYTETAISNLRVIEKNKESLESIS